MTKEEAIQVIRANGLYYVPQNTPVFEMLIDAFDMAIEALKQPEPKTGKWFDVGSLSCRCSECGCKSPKEFRYCPNCGVKMEVEE